MVFIALAALALSASPPESVEITFRASTQASTFWIVDRVSEWTPRHASSKYREAWEKQFPLDGPSRDLLRAYAGVRKKHASEAEFDAEDGLLPPATSRSKAFAVAFLSAPDVHAASAKLGLSADEERIVQRTFDLFRPQVVQLLAREAHLGPARERSEKWASETRLAGFLSRMARFYGVESATAPVLTVEFLWAPEGASNATCMGSHMVVPLPASMAKDEVQLQETMGVVVHELGHYLASLLPPETRRHFSKRVLASGGLPNRFHPNILEEATQTALGNILFMRQEFPAAFDPDSNFYGWETDDEWPDAIDSLSRALAPIAKRHLDTPGAFAKAFLEDALRAQAGLIPDRADHHARLALVYGENRRLIRFVNGLFPGIDRSAFPADSAGFLDAASRRSSLPRWFLLTQAGLKEGSAPVPAWSRTLLHRLETKDAACVQARRREPDGAWDFVVVGRNTGDVRRVLIALDRAPAIPGSPLCIPPLRAGGE